MGSVDQSDQSVSRSPNHIGSSLQSTSRSVGQSEGLSDMGLVLQSVSRSVGQSESRWYGLILSVDQSDQSVSRSPNHIGSCLQSISRSVGQSEGQ